MALIPCPSHALDLVENLAGQFLEYVRAFHEFEG